MTEPLSPWVAISSGDLTAEINPVGAQLSTLRDREDRELLWNGDAAVWAGRAPLLFPIVGALAGGAYRLGKDSYTLPRHGFARGSQFIVADSSVERAVFRLEASPETRKVYPFEFELTVEYRVKRATLTVTTRVANPNGMPLPASFGYHPGFRWPLPYGRARAEHTLEFAEDETAPIRRLDSSGLLTAADHPTPVAGRTLTLNDALFAEDVVIFDRLESRRLTYGAKTGPRLQIDFPDSPYLGVWTKPHDARFICIEPWHGIADPAGYDGDFTVKPGVVNIEPGATLEAVMSITLLEG